MILAVTMTKQWQVTEQYLAGFGDELEDAVAELEAQRDVEAEVVVTVRPDPACS